MRIFFALALLVQACFFCACARKLKVEISAIAGSAEEQQAGRLAGRRCLVLPAAADMRPDDLQFREFSAQLSASLAQKGCAPAQGFQDADLAVLLDYGIGEPLVMEERSYVAYRPWGRWSRGIPEYMPVTTTYVFHTCSLSLEARLVERAIAPSGGTQKDGAFSDPGAEDGARLGKQLWKIRAAHAGQRVDLRALFPWLLAAAKEYYGVDSGQNILVRVGEEDLLSAPLPPKNITAGDGRP